MDYISPKDTIAAGRPVRLNSDGTVVAVGDNEYGQCDVGGWCGILKCDLINLEVRLDEYKI